MSRTPIVSSLIHDPGDPCNIDDIFDRLTKLVRPHVEPVVGGKIRAEIANASYSEQEVVALTHALGEALQAQGASFSDLKKHMKEARQRLRDPSSVTPAEIDEITTDAVDESTAILVSSWGNVLIICATEGSGEISLASLDDCMLPPLDGLLDELFTEACGQSNLSLDEARGVLRAVKASIAPDSLPAEMIAILAHEDVVITT